MRFLFCAKRGEFCLQEWPPKLGATAQLAPRAEVAVLFLVQEWPPKLGATAQPAPRAEVAVLFLLQEAPPKLGTTAQPAPRADSEEPSRRLEQRWGRGGG